MPTATFQKWKMACAIVEHGAPIDVAPVVRVSLGETPHKSPHYAELHILNGHGTRTSSRPQCSPSSLPHVEGPRVRGQWFEEQCLSLILPPWIVAKRRPGGPRFGAAVAVRSTAQARCWPIPLVTGRAPLRSRSATLRPRRSAALVSCVAAIREREDQRSSGEVVRP